MMGTKKEDIELEGIVDSLEPTQDDFIGRRINHMNFAKVVLWILNQGTSADFIYASELARYMKITQTGAFTTLNNLTRVGFMKKKWASSNLVEFYLVKNGDTPLLAKYLNQAKKTLGVKF